MYTRMRSGGHCFSFKHSSISVLRLATMSSEQNSSMPDSKKAISKRRASSRDELTADEDDAMEIEDGGPQRYQSTDSADRKRLKLLHEGEKNTEAITCVNTVQESSVPGTSFIFISPSSPY